MEEKHMQLSASVLSSFLERLTSLLKLQLKLWDESQLLEYYLRNWPRCTSGFETCSLYRERVINVLKEMNFRLVSDGLVDLCIEAEYYIHKDLPEVPDFDYQKDIIEEKGGDENGNKEQV